MSYRQMSHYYLEILGIKVAKDGSKKYLVKFAGWPKPQWESEENVAVRTGFSFQILNLKFYINLFVLNRAVKVSSMRT